MLIRQLITEDSSLPLWASLIQKGLEKGVKFYFGSGSNRIVRLSRDRVRDAEYIVLHLEHKDSRKKQVYTVWEKTYGALALKKHEDGFVLRFRKDTEPVKEGVEEPMVVRLINNRIAKGGAVLVDVAVLPVGRRLKGWVTRPIEPVGTMDGLGNKMGTIYKLVTNDHPSGARGKVFYLTANADKTHTLKTHVDSKGNKVLKLVNRNEAA